LDSSYGRLARLSVPPTVRRRGAAGATGVPLFSVDGIASAWLSKRDTRRRMFNPDSGA
jgi:hypothetical protein